MEVLPPAPAGGFEQTSGRGEDEERRGNEKDQSKYPGATTNTTVMPYVERGTCQRIGPRVVAPHSRPPRRARSARGRSVRKNPVFGSVPWVVASFLKQTRLRVQTTQQGQEHTTRPDQQTEPEQKARGQGRHTARTPGDIGIGIAP